MSKGIQLKKHNSEIIHIPVWEEFKNLVISIQPKWLAYYITHAPLSQPPIGLRLMFNAKDKQYIFLDSARSIIFRKTRIPLSYTNKGKAYLKEEDLKTFLYKELNRKDVNILRFF
jgi:hypothetical protein